MKNRWKHIFIPVLTMALCLSLAACGNSDNVAGDDWRTTGMVVGSGTITHDGESVDVLVTVSESSAAFYRDLPEQVLFDSVSFPMNIPDTEQAFNAISFDDMDDDGESDVLVSFIHENGDATELIWIWDPVERYVFREDLSTVAISGGDLSGDDLSEYVGLWEYQGENFWLRIRDDATWEFVNDQDEVIEYGTLWVDEYGITLHFDGSGDTLQLDRTVSGDLMDITNGGSLFPVEGIQSQQPYFTRNGIEINAAVEMGTFPLEDGVCSYSGLGDGYNTDDCYWEITKTGDYTHDGIRELHFDAICYIPEDSIPYFDQQYTTVTSSELYDFYTGMWLTTSTAYGNSQRGDNYYLHTISWQGNSYLIEFAYSTDWQYNVGDWAQVLTKSYAVYLPEDYDGLVFAAEAQPDNYKDSAKRMQLDSISPEAALMDIDTVDPYRSLYFSLCY
ncbi:MAG: hypothetical protein MR705_05965 [Flintibacter sp.]|uniref:hypothetical protein n=1 Tax=Flintibacter sp. TaxID=1918624 RepID=UPI0026737A69|nr:hypothetical protein [Flintibacter sp.]MCI6149962.1 hypothetical protein [Flintibacter sp.]MDY5038347.1 hypothetical protein [Lawsonibacter sp.]